MTMVLHFLDAQTGDRRRSPPGLTASRAGQFS
jgi:hypothetical protein